MAKDNIETPNLFNPMMLWSDLGIRAYETMLSSSQNIGEDTDRLNRDNASPEASETAAASTETPNNPMMLWTDLGMRAWETMLSSSQNISEGIDRLSRANASPEASETAVAPIETISEEPAPALPARPDLSVFWQTQRFTMELMTQGWQQWMNTLGSLASLGAGRSFAETARQNPMLNAMQEVLLRSTDERNATRARPNAPSRTAGDRKRERHADNAKHAAAAAETSRRSRAGRATKSRSRSK